MSQVSEATGGAASGADNNAAATEHGLGDACRIVAEILAAGSADSAAAPNAGHGSELDFLDNPALRPLVASTAPSEVWAVDGGQAYIADARTIAVVGVRGACVRWRDGELLEMPGPIEVVVLGSGAERSWLAERGLSVGADTAVDIALLRDWTEWALLARCVEQASPGALVLLDGDLAPDWRVAPERRHELLDTAARRGVSVIGVTKHSSLALGAAPMVGVFEQRAHDVFGADACWWSEVAVVRREQTSPGLLESPEDRTAALLRVCIARLDRLAPFAFRIDVGGAGEPEEVLAALACVSNDAAFPGYPFPLSVVDAIAACSGWVRSELWADVRDGLVARGLDHATINRAFADRHHLMERV
jgi:hypothetical protein